MKIQQTETQHQILKRRKKKNKGPYQYLEKILNQNQVLLQQNVVPTEGSL